MPRLKALFAEWQARRRGARFVGRDIQRAARDIAGATGSLFSNGWQALERGYPAYLRSFEPRVPPSVHVSARDLTRATMPVPLVERCIEDWNKPPQPSDESPPAAPPQ